MRKDKNFAIRLRKQGKSYNEIVKILKIPKSTLSYWLRDIKIPPEIKTKFWNRTRKKWAENIIKFNKKRARVAREKSEKFQKIASRNINKLTQRELLLVGAALYWAEGYKKRRGTLQFSNSDPVMIKLMIKFFKKICKSPKEKIRATVQIHPNVTSEKAINYWSRISGVSKTQFTKCYSRLTSSSKQKRPFNTLPYGTLRIAIYDTQITDKVKGWIQGISKKF
ncbi:MAG: hypothetical protein WBC21_02290 [Minisyncoccales bacterium]